MEMTQIETLKAQAKNLKHAMTGMGISISLAQALEAIAQQYGMDNWDTLAGIVNKTDADAVTPAGPGYLPSVPYQVDMKGCSGLYIKCTVEHFDRDVLAFVYDEPALRHYLRNNSTKYPWGLATVAIKLVSPEGRVFEFRAAELLNMKWGNGDWYLTGGLVALRFHCHEDKPAAPAPKTELVIPQMVKSAKGCQLVILASGDGAQYDRHVIVPPHLDAEVISLKIRDEIRRLKQIDAEHEEDDNYDGYTDADLARYVGSIGCLWVEKPFVCGENWD